jgi:hypothetical protein
MRPHFLLYPSYFILHTFWSDYTKRLSLKKSKVTQISNRFIESPVESVQIAD